MQEQNSMQLELFSQPAPDGQGQKIERSFFGYVRTYEKAVLMATALLICGIIGFALGVEKGKRIGLSARNAHFDITQTSTLKQTPPAPAVAVNQAVPPIKQKAGSNVPAGSDAASGRDSGVYTIQLASYNSRDLAQKEFQALKKKGFSALLVTKGKYTVLCVGNFSSKENAQTLLVEFKKRYKTCYVRRL